MLLRRTITAIVCLVVFVGVNWLENPWFFTALAVIIAALAGYEFYRLVFQHKSRHLAFFGIAIMILLVLSPHCSLDIIKPLLITLAIVISLIWILSFPSKDHIFLNWTLTMAGILYLGWTISYWVDLRMLPMGREWIYWLIFISIANDIAAFFIGRAFGRHSLAPDISPKKTWEGSAGGLFFGTAASTVLGIALCLPLHYWQFIILGIIISVLSQLGDLVESLIKRNSGVKDSGTLVPGHGGILDRIDSYIFPGVIVYYFLTIFIL